MKSRLPTLRVVRRFSSLSVGEACQLLCGVPLHVVSKMQRSHITMIESTLKRLDFVAPANALVPLKEVHEQADMRGGEYFNVSSATDTNPVVCWIHT